MRTFKLISSVLCSVAIFIGFMMLVGSPSEVETIIGLCLAIGTFVWLYFGKAIGRFIDKLKEDERE